MRYQHVGLTEKMHVKERKDVDDAEANMDTLPREKRIQGSA